MFEPLSMQDIVFTFILWWLAFWKVCSIVYKVLIEVLIYNGIVLCIKEIQNYTFREQGYYFDISIILF